MICRKQDFMKSENSKANYKPKSNELEDKMYRVLSTQTIEKGEMFLKALIRFLESKYRKVFLFLLKRI